MKSEEELQQEMKVLNLKLYLEDIKAQTSVPPRQRITTTFAEMLRAYYLPKQGISPQGTTTPQRRKSDLKRAKQFLANHVPATFTKENKMKTQMKRKGLTLGKLMDILNKNFCPPFVQERLVKANLSRDGESLSIYIGERDIQIDRNGNIIGAGTRIK